MSGNAFSNEQSRDDRREAQTVMDLAEIRRGMTVADIGAGEGYYTVRLAERVGKSGRVLAEDIDARRAGPARQPRRGRTARQRFDQDWAPKTIRACRAGSFERIFMVHMYHEVSEPYAFLWRLRPALQRGRASDRGRR